MRKLAECMLWSLVLTLLPVPLASALTLRPAKVDLAPTGAGATGTFVVQNNSGARIAVELYMAERRVDVDGTETMTRTDEGFLLYPAQVVLDPGETRNVRVSWAGDPNPPRELAYRLVCEQLPVDLTPQVAASGAHIRVLVRYVGSVYVVPKAVRSDVVVESASSEADGQVSTKLKVVLDNRGTAHALLKGLTLRLVPVTPDGTAPRNAGILLSGDGLKGIYGENILAQTKRRFLVAWPEAIPVGPVRVEIEFDRGR